MNILVIAHYQGDGSPCAIFVHEQLKELVKSGNRVLVISPIAIGKKCNYSKYRLHSECVNIDCIVYVYLRHISLSRLGEDGLNQRLTKTALNHRIIKKIQKFKPEIIHVHTFGIDSGVGIFLKEKMGIPLVITTHGSDLEIPMKDNKTEKIAYFIREADYIVTISDKLSRMVQMIYPDILVKTILNGCDIKKCKVAEKKRRSILFVGNLISQKNANLVIKTYAKLKQKYSDFELTIIGDGIEKNKLQSLCKNYNINKDVVFTGRIPNKDVIEYMSNCEYFVMPSINEGFGIVYIEAMASGCITVGTKGEGIDGFIINGENGFLCRPEEEEIYSVILKCEENEVLRRSISQKAYEKAHLLTWKENAFEYLKLFEELLGL